MINKIRNGLGGLFSSISLNAFALRTRKDSKKLVIFQLHAANQLPHIAPVLEEFEKNSCGQLIRIVVLVAPNEIANTIAALHESGSSAKVFSYYSTSFLLFWDALISVDQRIRLPLVRRRRGSCICMFHGQPTKGNVYSGFNFKRTDGLFFYGPLMRDYYFEQKAMHPEWPMIRTWDIGQPKTDWLFKVRTNRVDARKHLGLSPSLKTVIYAPSFEYCSSLATHGEEIISALLLLGLNVIIKPHPAFYRVVNEKDTYFYGAPSAAEWHDRAEKFTKVGNLVFPVDEQIDAKLALSAADVLITDYSGIAFDAILLDLPVVYFDCPEFFDDYLPSRFGVDGDTARHEVTCNAGRSAGVLVTNVAEMKQALKEYLEEPHLNAAERKDMRDSLLFNQGRASEEFMRKIAGILGLQDD